MISTFVLFAFSLSGPIYALDTNDTLNGGEYLFRNSILPKPLNEITELSVSNPNSRAASKTITYYVDSSINSFSNYYTYDDGTYEGVLTKSGSSFVLSGSYTPSDTKYVYGTTWHNRDVWEYESFNGYQESPRIYGSDGTVVSNKFNQIGSMGVSYRTSWKWDGSDGVVNLSENYSDSDGYKGTLTVFGTTNNGRYLVDTSTQYWDYPACNKGEPRSKVKVYTRTDKVKLEGYVTKPAVDTRVYRQAYTGTVTNKDKIAPSVKPVTFNWSSSNSVTISVEATDTGGSGLAFIELYDSSNKLLKTSTTSPLVYTYTPTVEGITNFYAYAEDNAENRSTTNSNIQVKIDKTNPAATLSPNSKTWTNGNIPVSISVSDSLSGVKSWRYAISSDNGSSWGTWITGSGTTGSTTISTEGNSKIKVEVTDNAGNVNTITSGSYRIDKVIPSATLSPNSKTWTNGNIPVSISVSDSLSGVKSWRYAVSSDNGATWGAWTTGSGTSGSTTISTEGNSKIKVEVTDNAGNVNTITSGSYQIDKTNPSATLNPSNKTWTNGNIPVTITVSDNSSGVKSWRYAVSSDNGTNWGTWITGSGTSGSTTISTEGNSKIKVEVTDNAGNVNTITSGSYQIDKVTPAATLSPNSKTWTNGNIPVSISVSDSLSGVKSWRYAVSSDNGSSWGTWITGSGTTGSTTISTEGNSKIKVEVTDNAGNVNTITSGSYQIDKVIPAVALSPNGKTWTNRNIPVSISVSDSLSGVKSWRYAVSSDNGTNWGTWITGSGTSGSTTISTEGNSKIKVEVTDNAGNVTTITSGSYQIDKTLPSVQYNPNGRPWNNTNIDVNIVPSDAGGSGLDYWIYRSSSDNGLTWGNWSSQQPTLGSTITLSTTGTWIIEVKVIDKAGNTNVSKSNPYLIDKVNPTARVYTSATTNSRNITIHIDDIVDLNSGIKEVTIGNYENDIKAIVTNISGKSNVSINFELDKKNTAEDNYGNRLIYVTLRDNANNIQKYILTTKLLPKTPSSPIITNPVNDSLFLLNEKISLRWSYTDTVNDFPMSPERFEIIIKDKFSNNIKKYEVNGTVRNFNINDLSKGSYDISVRCYVSETVYSESVPVLVRVGKFKSSGNVKTISILPGAKIRYVAISTESEIPKGTTILGKIYYKYNSNNVMDRSVSIPFKITSDYQNNILKLPENSAKIEVEYFLRNDSNKDDLSPILDSIIVFAR